jgi:hypothetical protein
VLIGCVALIVMNIREKRAAAPFKTMTEQARTLCAQCFSPGEEPPAPPAPYRQGKLLAVSADSGEALGLTMARLSPELGATSPEQVGTLVCVGEVQREKVWSYTDRQPGYRLHRDLCIYDVVAERVVLTDMLSGDMPPPSKQSSGAESGSDPLDKALIPLLETLPAR